MRAFIDFLSVVRALEDASGARRSSSLSALEPRCAHRSQHKVA